MTATSSRPGSSERWKGGRARSKLMARSYAAPEAAAPWAMRLRVAGAQRQRRRELARQLEGGLWRPRRTAHPHRDGETEEALRLGLRLRQRRDEVAPEAERGLV